MKCCGHTMALLHRVGKDYYECDRCGETRELEEAMTTPNANQSVVG
jgi:hypothetical protein